MSKIRKRPKPKGEATPSPVELGWYESHRAIIEEYLCP